MNITNLQRQLLSTLISSRSLSSIQIHDFGHIQGIGIYGYLFARNHVLGVPYIHIFDWEKSTSSSHCKAIIFPDVNIVRSTIATTLFIADAQIFRTRSASIQAIDFLAFSNEHMMI